jgi:hypothetical protein
MPQQEQGSLAALPPVLARLDRETFALVMIETFPPSFNPVYAKKPPQGRASGEL